MIGNLRRARLALRLYRAGRIPQAVAELRGALGDLAETSLAHFWLGASLFLAPVSAWIALRGPVDMATPVILGLAVLFWVAGFDILYACQDAEHDRHARAGRLDGQRYQRQR